VTRFIILVGFALMFGIIHQQGELNKYINTKYAYLSISAIIMLLIMCVIELIRVNLEDKAKLRREEQAQNCSCEQEQEPEPTIPHHGQPVEDDRHDHAYKHEHAHSHKHNHGHDHHHHNHHDDHDDDFGHSHEPASRWKRSVGYLILLFPIATGIFLPVHTLDSSFVKAKGFTFPASQEILTDDTPGEHQFLKPDSSVFYGKEGYESFKNKELAEFADADEIRLNDDNYMKGMEVIYNFPGQFMSKTVSFTGFAYRGEQIAENQYFVFRFGFLHCAADSGIFGMLVEFPKGTSLDNDDWVHVSGKLTSQLYQPFKQTIPVLRVESWERIPDPVDPYVYRSY
jgi:putative membrane protein